MINESISFWFLRSSGTKKDRDRSHTHTLHSFSPRICLENNILPQENIKGEKQKENKNKIQYNTKGSCVPPFLPPRNVNTTGRMRLRKKKRVGYRDTASEYMDVG